MDESERDESRKRILIEVQRLRGEIHRCAHCASLRAQMVHLLILLPPEPIIVRREGLLRLLEAHSRCTGETAPGAGLVDI